MKARISGKLADGRDIFYFDDASSSLPQARKQDTRDLPERPQTAQLRFDPLSSEWITVASHRQQRAFLPPAHACPLCPTTQDMEATSANLLRKECQGCSEARRPSRHASRIQSSGAIVTSQPWIQLTGGYARCSPLFFIRRPS